MAAPILAWGLLACAVPVLIHLTLRQKPRRQVFPALRFLMATHQRSTRAYRLRRFLLLACRMLVLGLLVMMLMKVGCLPGGEAVGRGWLAPAWAPVSVVLCIDDSASMGYRDHGRTRVEEAVDEAVRWVTDRRQVPPGSQIAVVSGSAPGEAAWTNDASVAVRKLGELTAGEHGRGVAVMLERAYGLMAEAEHPFREVYLFTDLTEPGWRVQPPAPPTGVPLFVVDVGREGNDNAALFVERWPSGEVPEGRPFVLPIRVRAGDRAVEAVVDIVIDGRRRDRRTLGAVPANSEVGFPLSIPALEHGRHALTLALHGEDALAVDNARHLALSVGEPPVVVVIEHPVEPEVGTLLANMIAPVEQDPLMHDYQVVRRTPDALDSEELAGVRLVILADAGPPAAEDWQALRTYVAGGGAVLIIPGPNTATADFADGGDLLPAEMVTLEAGLEAMTVAAADLTHPFLAPFADPVMDSINDRRVFRRVRLGEPGPRSHVLAPFSDGAPAIVEARVGRGRVILSAFSPARAWGQFGTQAAPMIVLIHTMLESLAPPATDVGLFTVGQPVLRALPEVDPAVVYGPAQDPDDRAPNRPQGGGTPVPLEARGERFLLPTHQSGHYRVGSDGNGSSAAYLYAVNVDEQQSDRRRVAMADLEGWFPPGVVTVTADLGKLDRRTAAGAGVVRLTVPLALLLLLVLIVESLFANRFYGQNTTTSIQEPSRPRGLRTDQKPHF